MLSSLSSWAYRTGFGGDPIVKDLKKGFGRLQKSQKKEAAILIKKALQSLREEQPSAFEEARRSGSGRFIDIIKASAVAMFAGEKLLFEKDIVNAGKGKGFRQTENGYQQKICSTHGQQAFENAVSVEEFAGYFVRWMAKYSETYEKEKITSMNDAVAIIGASGIHISARWIIRTCIWDSFKDGLFGEPREGDYQENHVEWLLEKSLEEIDRRRSNGFQLPGKDKNDRKAQLETALCESTAINHDLSSSARDLVTTNTTLVASSIQKDEEIKELKGKIAILEQPAAVAAEPENTSAKGSAKKVTVAPAPVSSKKKKATAAAKDHDFANNEKVSIKRTYTYKPEYAGKHGEVAPSTKTNVTVQFEDGAKAITLSHKSLEHGWM